MDICALRTDTKTYHKMHEYAAAQGTDTLTDSRIYIQICEREADMK